MAFRFGDPGGRMYGSASFLLAHWTAVANSVSIVSGQGRTVGSCLRMAPSFNQSALSKTLDSQQTWGVALAFRATAVNFAPFQIVGLYDTGTNQVSLNLNSDGTLSLARGGTLLGTTTGAISANVWYHLEVKFKIHSSTGTAELRINGATKIGPLTSQNTQQTANSTVNGLLVQGGPTSGAFGVNYDFDDIIIWDGQTTDPAGNGDIHDFIGDCGLSWVQPSGAGAHTAFTPDSGSNYARVNEGTPDTTSYVEDLTVSDKDTYTASSIPATASVVKSIAVCHYAEKTDVGTRTMGALIRTASTDFTHPTEIDLKNSYIYSFRPWGSNPNTTSNWSVSEINALEIGQVVAS